MATHTALPAVASYPDLAGKVAVVTGGSKGIGAATSLLLGRNGVRVAVGGRDQSSIEEVVGEIQRAGGEARGYSADITSFGETESLRDRVEKDLGPTDIVIAFAGGFLGIKPLWEIEEDDWRSIIDSNLTSTFLTLKAFLPGMIERRSGSIVTMASNAGRLLDMRVTASYAASKAGIAMLTRHAALEVGEFGIRVNCVAPATTLTARVERNLPRERREQLAQMAPLRRLGKPEDTAQAAVFLASEAAGWMTGVTIDVAGGRTML
jgi:3-oxoacyl-[acyl-carrier protein] reductase